MNNNNIDCDDIVTKNFKPFEWSSRHIMWYTLRVSWIFSPQHTHTHLNHDSRVTPNCWSSNLQPQMTNNDVMRVTYACWNFSIPMPISCSLCYVNVDSVRVHLEYIFLHGIPCFLVFFIIFVVEHKKSRTTNVQTKMGITLILYCWWSDVISEGQMFVQKIKCKLCTTDAHKQKITTHAKHKNKTKTST